MIIGIAGRIGSGKDTMGKMIQYLDSRSPKPYEDWSKSRIYRGYDIGDLSLYQEEHDSWKIKKFAGKLKDIASMLTGIPVEKFEDQGFKKTNLGQEWWSERDLGGGIIEGIPMTVREFLQRLGTDAIRDNLHGNTWVNALFADYKQTDKWLITDTRFPNEAKAIKDRGGIVVRVVRPSEVPVGKIGLHPSETALDDWKFDVVIENDKGLDKLLHLTEEVLINHDMIAPINHEKN